jgi:hypothetical protein
MYFRLRLGKSGTGWIEGFLKARSRDTTEMQNPEHSLSEPSFTPHQKVPSIYFGKEMWNKLDFEMSQYCLGV